VRPIGATACGFSPGQHRACCGGTSASSRVLHARLREPAIDRESEIGKLVVIGVGLIGGSFAAALKKARMVRRVVGVGRTRNESQCGVAPGDSVVDGIADRSGRSGAGVRTSYFSASPVGQLAEVVARRIAPHIDGSAVIADGGSTKQDVIAHAERFLGAITPGLWPSHPIAARRTGCRCRRPGFSQEKTSSSPAGGTSPAAVRRVREAWLACGAVSSDSTPGSTITSSRASATCRMWRHFPSSHARRQRDRPALRLLGGGLRDTVRIAGQSPEMWRTSASRTASRCFSCSTPISASWKRRGRRRGCRRRCARRYVHRGARCACALAGEGPLVERTMAAAYLDLAPSSVCADRQAAGLEEHLQPLPAACGAGGGTTHVLDVLDSDDTRACSTHCGPRCANRTPLRPD